MDWFLYANRLGHERVKKKRHTQERNQESVSHLVLFLLLSSHPLSYWLCSGARNCSYKKLFLQIFPKTPEVFYTFFYNQLHFGVNVRVA